ncbi:MAG: hypothetical protein R2716_00455 [Microthrixaceae bacterium]
MAEPTESAHTAPDLFDKIVNLTKRRGFVYPSAEIYGGFRSTYDYGPLGVLLLRNVKEAWWTSMVQHRGDVVGLDASILSPPAVWEASGHLANFTDPLVDCTNCKNRFRLDKLEDPEQCPSCGKRGTFTEPRQFNLMFETQAGPVADASAKAYLRPETAQGMFINFKNVIDTTRVKPPSGSPRSASRSATRSRRGSSCSAPASSSRWRWSTSAIPTIPPSTTSTGATSATSGTDHGMPADALRLRTHDSDELSHYSSGTSDVEFLFPWGWDELEGIANRGDYDLRQHAEHSGSAWSGTTRPTTNAGSPT